MTMRRWTLSRTMTKFDEDVDTQETSEDPFLLIENFTCGELEVSVNDVQCLAWQEAMPDQPFAESLWGRTLSFQKASIHRMATECIFVMERVSLHRNGL